jgi:toxin ParE1/3/4
LKRIHLRRVAKRDLRDAIGWYRERNPAVAERFSAAFESTIEHLEEFPSAGAYAGHLAGAIVRSLPVEDFPYRVLFVRLGERISVVAIAHVRRRPGYWE